MENTLMVTVESNINLDQEDPSVYELDIRDIFKVKEFISNSKVAKN